MLNLGHNDRESLLVANPRYLPRARRHPSSAIQSGTGPRATARSSPRRHRRTRSSPNRLSVHFDPVDPRPWRTVPTASHQVGEADLFHSAQVWSRDPRVASPTFDHAFDVEVAPAYVGELDFGFHPSRR